MRKTRGSKVMKGQGETFYGFKIIAKKSRGGVDSPPPPPPAVLGLIVKR